jgi:hypothetical protein
MILWIRKYLKVTVEVVLNKVFHKYTVIIHIQVINYYNVDESIVKKHDE